MFSVIIPAYNAEKFIEASIRSVLAQTVPDFEIVVVDDGSRDRTAEIVRSMADDRIRYIYRENGGVSAARNTGIQNATGEYVCFLDADDFWRPNHLAVVHRLIRKFSACDVYLTGYEILLHDGRTVQRDCPLASEDMQSDNVFKLIRDYGYFIHTNSIACRKSVFGTVGLFAVGVKNGEDDDMWYRLFCHYSAAISDERTTVYVRENSRATSSKIFVEDWIFLTRVKDVMSSKAVSEEKKYDLVRLLEQRKLSSVRADILNRDKKSAWNKMKRLDVRMLRVSKYVVTVIALLLPSCVSIRLVRRRDRAYYGK
jgi:glycosyltransferase involved in cell wall biosynthesis